MENKFIFFDKIIKDELKNLTFVVDLSSKNEMYSALSKHDSNVFTYSINTFSQKLKSLYKEMFGENLELQKGDIASLTNSIINVDKIVNDLSIDRGLIFNKGFNFYNHWNPSEVMLKVKEVNSKRNKQKYENNFNWFNYSHINFLINHLLNEEENIALNHKKQKVDLKKHFLNWLSYSLQTNTKSGQAVVFISPMHGTGKNVFSNIIKTYYGKDYYAYVNNDTFTSVHNAILDNKLFVFFNESEIKYQDYEKVSSKLKTLITEEDQIIRKMREDQIIRKSYFNMIINSNNSVPFKIEYNDRRFTVVKNKITSLKEAVENNLNLSITEFVKQVENETFDFLCDLLNLDSEKEQATYNALMTDAKKVIIKATNTQINNVINLINTNDIEGLKDYFFDCEREDLLNEFLEQVSLKFLTNDIVNNFLHLNLKETDKTENTSSKLSKKQFWDKKLGEAKLVVFNKNGSKTSMQVRQLSGFETKNVEKFYNKSKNNMTFDYDEDNQEYI